MKWVELSAEVKADKVTEVATLLGQYGQGGATIEEGPSGITAEKVSKVKIYVPYMRSFKTKRQEIDQSLASLQILPHLRLEEKILKPEDWLDSLKQHFKTIEIGEKFIIRPSWEDRSLKLSNRISIELDPGVAFGTGLHPTTHLCLLRLEKHLRKGMSVFDLGTGTGILSIAAAKLGASPVLALDIDPVAVRSAQYNARVNGVSELIQIKRGTLSARMQNTYLNNFDIVIANITSRTISDLSPAFASVLKPGSELIVSGIHPQGLDEVLISLAMADLTLEAIDREGQWHAVVASKPERPVN